MEKKYFNSQEWGILKKGLGDQRSNGIDFLVEKGFPTTKNVSYYSNEFYSELENINKMMQEASSSFIVIFDPITPDIKRCSIPGKTTTKLSQVMDFIKEKDLNINNYKITFIERMLAVDDSFCGVVMTNGKGDTVIEILQDSINLIDLTSAGVDPTKTQYYEFDHFEESHVVPYLINKIKMDTQHYEGYYEFIYGQFRGRPDVYYTYYSNNKDYINIFENSKNRQR